MSALRIASLCNVQFSFQLQNQNRRCHCTSDCSSSSWSLKSGSFSFTQKKMPHDVKTNPCRQDFRWVGGISHINSSQQSTFHWNTVEITSHGRTFYGTGLTATAAENNVRAKADLFTKIGMTHKDGTEKGEYAELLCGHAPVPGMLYKDLLPTKDQVGPGCEHFVSDRRLYARINPEIDPFREPEVHVEPKVEKIRKFIGGLPDARLDTVRGILGTNQEYWDGVHLLSQGKAWRALKDVMEGCDPGIMIANDTFTPKDAPESVFACRLMILGCEMAGFGATEQAARQHVALSFLLWIRKQTLDLLWRPAVSDETVPLNPRVSEGIAQAVATRYNGLMKLLEASGSKNAENISQHMAAVVLQEFSTFRVIALAAGHGTILSDAGNMSKDGAGFLIKDCHAEVLVLRAAKLFLYDQLELFLSDDVRQTSQSVFTAGPQGSIVMKLGLSLHLYVNGKPCGHPDVVRSEPLNNSNVSRAEPFRLYEKCARGKGESARPLAAGKCEQAVLRIMSCCDKLQKRCFLGIQGHFLSQLILPIYLGAIVVGKEKSLVPRSKSDPMYAVHQELERLYPMVLTETKFPFGFEAVSPVVVSYPAIEGPGIGASGYTGKVEKTPKEIAFVHYCDRGKTLLEYLNPETGKQVDGSFSLLCKRALFLRFRAIYEAIPEEHLPCTATLNPRFRGTYCECKNAAVEYLAQKELFSELVKKAVEEKDGQQWVRKNQLYEKFTCVLEPPPANYNTVGL